MTGGLSEGVPQALWPAIVDSTSFESMKGDADTLPPEVGMGFTGGATSFISKETNRRCHDVRTADELNRYGEAVARSLTPACARWLEHGREARRSQVDLKPPSGLRIVGKNYGCPGQPVPSV